MILEGRYWYNSTHRPINSKSQKDHKSRYQSKENFHLLKKKLFFMITAFTLSFSLVLIPWWKLLQYIYTLLSTHHIRIMNSMFTVCTLWILWILIMSASKFKMPSHKSRRYIIYCWSRNFILFFFYRNSQKKCI